MTKIHVYSICTESDYLKNLGLKLEFNNECCPLLELVGVKRL